MKIAARHKVTLQKIAVSAINDLMLSLPIDWAKIYHIERQFCLQGYSEKIFEALKQSRRAYLAGLFMRR